MKLFIRAGCLVFFGFVFSATAIEYGLAQKYPGDLNILSDSNVVLFENFEQASVNDLGTGGNRWFLGGAQTKRFESSIPTNSAGKQSLRMDNQGVSATGLFKQFGKDYQELYARFYVNYNLATCERIHHGVWLGGDSSHTGSYYGYACAGAPPLHVFSAGMEPGDFINWFVYAYSYNMQPNMEGQHCGNTAHAVPVPRGRWECVEIRLKMNTHPDSMDGEFSGWINGEKVLHLGKGFPMGRWINPGAWSPLCRTCIPFPGFQWRPWNYFSLNWFYLQHDVDGDDCSVLYDNVVIAKKYIGPIPGSVEIETTPITSIVPLQRSFSWRRAGNGALQFILESAGAEPIELVLYNIAGKPVWKQSWTGSAQGEVRATWEPSTRAPQGVLLAKVTQNGWVSAYRVAMP